MVRIPAEALENAVGRTFAFSSQARPASVTFSYLRYALLITYIWITMQSTGHSPRPRYTIENAALRDGDWAADGGVPLGSSTRRIDASAAATDLGSHPLF